MNFIQIAIGGKQDDDENYEQSGDEEQDDEEQDDDEQSGDEEQDDEEQDDDEQDDDEEQSEKLNFPEDDYESSISNLHALITYLNNARIHEVWRVTTIEQNKEHFVVICNNANHLCTCMWLVTRGLVCRHFFSVMLNSDKAMFHIGLIPDRWYNEKFPDFQEEPAITICSERTNLCINIKLSQILAYYMKFVIHKHFQKLSSKIYLIEPNIIKVSATRRKQLDQLLKWL